MVHFRSVFLVGAFSITSVVLTACGVMANSAPSESPAIVQSGGSVSTDNQSAPSFTLKDIDGKMVSLADYRGRPLLVNFWATWCVPCRAEMPHLVAAYEKHKADGFVLLAINATTQDDAAAIQPFVKAFGMMFPVLLDSDGVAWRAFRLRGLPSSYFVNAQGILRFTYVGAMTPEFIEERIAALNGR